MTIQRLINLAVQWHQNQLAPHGATSVRVYTATPESPQVVVIDLLGSRFTATVTIMHAEGQVYVTRQAKAICPMETFDPLFPPVFAKE